MCFLQTSKRNSKEARFSRRRRDPSESIFSYQQDLRVKKVFHYSSNRFKTRKTYRINGKSREGLTLKMEIFDRATDWRKQVKKFNF